MRVSHVLTSLAVALAGVSLASTSAAAAPDAGVPEDLDQKPTGTLRITEPGTVVDGAHVNGMIHILADDVTVIRSKVTYGGYHSIWVSSGADNARIIDSTVECRVGKERNNREWA